MFSNTMVVENPLVMGRHVICENLPSSDAQDSSVMLETGMRPTWLGCTLATTKPLVLGAWSLAKVFFTANIQRHVACPETEAAGLSVREVLDNVFAGNPQARSYVLDDQASLRRHMTIFVDGHAIRDRARLSDPVSASSTIRVLQALSGG